MSEFSPRGDVQRSPVTDGSAAYQLGDLSTIESVTVAAGGGNTKEGHGSEYKGGVLETLGGVTSTFVDRRA